MPRSQVLSNDDEGEDSSVGTIFPVVGAGYRISDVKAAHRLYCKGNESVSVVPEPTNEHDPAALKVVISNKHVGYIGRGHQYLYSTTSRFVIHRFTVDAMGNARITIQKVR